MAVGLSSQHQAGSSEHDARRSSQCPSCVQRNDDCHNVGRVNRFHSHSRNSHGSETSVSGGVAFCDCRRGQCADFNDDEFDHDRWRKLCIALVVLGTIASMMYPSSPFRLLTRDFQSSCYDGGRRLQEHPGSRVVTIGSGPFPEHGVGWEAGFKASFFGERRIIAATEALPQSTQLSSLAADIRKASPDAILVWGKHGDTRYAALLETLAMQYPRSSSEKIVDPVLGEVGTVLFTAPTIEAASSVSEVGRTPRHWLSSLAKMLARQPV